jgi:hypothetical protein
MTTSSFDQRHPREPRRLPPPRGGSATGSRRRAGLRAGILALGLLGFPGLPGGEGLTASLGAQGGPSPYRVEARTDWGKQSLEISIELNLGITGLRPPAGRLEAERMIERDLPGLLKEAVFSLPVDSHRLVEDSIADGSIDITRLLPIADEARLLSSVFSADFQTFRTVWNLPLEPIIALYVRHAAPFPLRPLLGWSPTRTWTGIVIDATGLLPVHGEAVEDRLRACLFPRVWDEDMRLLLDRNTVAPEALRLSGPVAYGSSIGEPPLERGGADPLTITARELFGEFRTDVVISREDARRILSSPENRALLAAGRVYLAVDAPVTSLAY